MNIIERVQSRIDIDPDGVMEAFDKDDIRALVRLAKAAKVAAGFKDVPHFVCDGGVEGFECECGATDFNKTLYDLRAALAALEAPCEP